uniref:Heat shock transcription factor 2 binding protein n=1 Tax=Eptatretus burgeri TaxID=7764 RepID=A0A8C4Q982_EPTBU
MADVQCETHVLVSSSELKGMVSEITNLKNQVPKVLAEVFDKASKVESLEKALESKCKEMEKLKVECQHLTAKVEVWMVECEKEKEDKLILRKKVAETRQHLAHQAEYCTAFGAAACTLLWRVSRSEDTVQTILNGAKVEEFFTLTSQTLDSFMKSMIEEGKRKNIDEEENQFVLAMAGTITNVAAASCGREYLASTSAGKIVLDVFLQLLMQMGVGQCIKLKTLILMALYNVTINCNGLKYIAEKNGVANLLCWLLQISEKKLKVFMNSWKDG